MGSSAGCAHAVNRVSVPFLWQAAKNIHRVKMKSGNRNSPGWLMWVQVPWRIALEGNKRLIGAISALKLLLHPALVYVMAVPILHLPPLMAGSALLFAACPTGVNAYLLAERYRTGQSVTSGAISLTTMLAIFTMTVVVSVVMGFGK